MKKRSGFGVALCLFIALNLFSPSLFCQKNKVQKKASFIPLWFPQAQFGGYYVAYKKGFYENHGIDLEIKTGGSERSSTDMLGEKSVDFAAAWLSDAIQRRAGGMKLVNIAQIIQRLSPISS